MRTRGIGVVDENNSHAVLCLLSASVKMDHRSTQRKNAGGRRVPSRFYHHANFGLQFWPVIQTQISPLQTYIADRGLLFEIFSVFRLSAHDRGKTQTPSLPHACFAHLHVHPALAHRDGHPFGGGPCSRKFLPCCRKKTIHNLVERIRVVVKENQVPHFSVA